MQNLYYNFAYKVCKCNDLWQKNLYYYYICIAQTGYMFVDDWQILDKFILLNFFSFVKYFM